MTLRKWICGPQACLLQAFLCLVIWVTGVAGVSAGDVPGTGRSMVQRSALTNLLIEPGAAGTCFRIQSLGTPELQIFPVTDPDRVVIDAENAVLQLSGVITKFAGGLVGGLRYGRLDNGKVRVVIDVARGTRIANVTNEKLAGRAKQVSLHLSSERSNSAGGDRICRGAKSRGVAAAAWSKSLSIERAEPPVKRRPIIVIDPGHGGIDPGAVVGKQLFEKLIVLAVGRRLVKRLRTGGRFETVMTRTGDKFLSLYERIERTREVKGDLFISLHADSVDDATQAAVARGAAVYILSHKASDAEAKKLADKENAADLLGGVLPKTGREGGVRNILVDLLARETERESARLRKLLIAAMRSKVSVSRRPSRAAAFRVLKQTETPAALIELGFMTNMHDLRLMRQAEWQNRMANAIGEAIERFFDEK